MFNFIRHGQERGSNNHRAQWAGGPLVHGQTRICTQQPGQRAGVLLILGRREQESPLFVVVVVCLFFRDRVSLYSPGCPRTHFVDQAGLELRNPPASASRVLGLKVCATTPSQQHLFIKRKILVRYSCLGNISRRLTPAVCGEGSLALLRILLVTGSTFLLSAEDHAGAQKQFFGPLVLLVLRCGVSLIGPSGSSSLFLPLIYHWEGKTKALLDQVWLPLKPAWSLLIVHWQSFELTE